MRISLYILRVLEYNLNEGFCLPCSAGTYKQKSRQDAGTPPWFSGVPLPVSGRFCQPETCHFCAKLPDAWQNASRLVWRIGILYNYRFPDSSSLHKNFAYLLTFLLGYSIIRIIGTAWIREAIPAEILTKFYHLQSAGPEHRRGCKQFRGG